MLDTFMSIKYIISSLIMTCKGDVSLCAVPASGLITQTALRNDRVSDVAMKVCDFYYGLHNCHVIR